MNSSQAALAIGTECHKGAFPSQNQYVKFDNPYLHVTACKQAEDRDTTILRFFNLTDKAQTLNATLCDCVTKVYRTNLNEERMDELTLKDGVLTMEIPKKKIVTIELV